MNSTIRTARTQQADKPRTRPLVARPWTCTRPNCTSTRPNSPTASTCRTCHKPW